jgi:hypothetical protein
MARLGIAAQWGLGLQLGTRKIVSQMHPKVFPAVQQVVEKMDNSFVENLKQAAMALDSATPGPAARAPPIFCA